MWRGAGLSTLLFNFSAIMMGNLATDARITTVEHPVSPHRSDRQTMTARYLSRQTAWFSKPAV